MDRDWPVPMDDLKKVSAEAILVPLKTRADAMMGEMRAGLAAEGLALVNAADLWAKIEAYVAAQHEHGRSMCCSAEWDTEAIEQTIPPLANDIRAVLGLDPLS